MEFMPYYFKRFGHAIYLSPKTEPIQKECTAVDLSLGKYGEKHFKNQTQEIQVHPKNSDTPKAFRL